MELERAIELLDPDVQREPENAREYRKALELAAWALRECAFSDGMEAIVKDSPCVTCNRGKCPASSKDEDGRVCNTAVGCKRWRNWFSERWYVTRNRILCGRKRKR